jgi:REP element-mobilizing transposase RayT
MSLFIHKSHNVSVLLYHLVCPAKYRRVVFDEAVDAVLKEVCLDISLRYEISFLEIGTDRDHVHFLVQSVPTYSPTKIVRTIKSITAREIFARCPHVKKQLWGGQFWSDGYFIASVGQHGNEDTIGNYVRGQGQDNSYQKLHSQPRDQLTLMDGPASPEKLNSKLTYSAACGGDFDSAQLIIAISRLEPYAKRAGRFLSPSPFRR